MVPRFQRYGLNTISGASVVLKPAGPLALTEPKSNGTSIRPCAYVTPAKKIRHIVPPTQSVPTSGNGPFVVQPTTFITGGVFYGINAFSAVLEDFDGDLDQFDPSIACVWLNEVVPVGDSLRGATVETPTAFHDNDAAVGIQYRDANPNSVGPGGGRSSSWIWIRGDQTVTSTDRADFIHMPDTTFGYPLCSLAAGNSNMPGGSTRRLCLGGNIGRHANQVISSGSSGSISTPIDPAVLPQPTGRVAAQFGQPWNFQFWHRDASLGDATSNFSNACKLTFWN
ncbi:MAG: hypothetical protein AAF726_09010 [Planctomycetota bacterium]